MTNKTPDLLTLVQPGRPWASHVVMSEAELDDSVRAIPLSANTTVRIVRGRRCTSKERLFQEWAAALQFPSYFGENWDAFEDCLLDRGWLPGNLHVVCIATAEVLLHEGNMIEGTFWDVLKSAAESSHGPELRVILQTSPGKEASTRKALERLGISV